MLVPCGSVVPLPLATGPNGVPDKRPLPLGSGGGASFCRAGFVGGVGALEWEGVTECVELDLSMGTDIGLLASVSMSMAVGSRMLGYCCGDWDSA